MSVYFLDSSALVKRYTTETGSGWVSSLAERTRSDTIAVAEIARVEVAAAVAARHRASGGITLGERDAAISLMLRHFDKEYLLIPVTSAVIGRAVELTQRHRLRGYDAV